ncbi:MAG: hypothetical protein FD149_2542 [Rhodospirillaceae bacterium]|nr:MAG: hypothetical protein FD149_2542 [Rhodospirillaceae bacterium]
MIVDGTLDKIEFAPGEGVRIRESLLRAIAESRIKADDVTKADMEEALLRMNDLPGVSAKAGLQPGAKPGFQPAGGGRR